MKGLSKFFSAITGQSTPRPALGLLSFDTTGWTPIQRDAGICRWINEHRDELTLSFEEGQPNLEFDPRDVETGREFFRHATREIGQGFVELSHLVLCAVDASRYIIKVKQNPTGVAYISGIKIPFNNCSWSITILCKELRATGLRESLVLNEKVGNGEVKPDVKNGQMIGWVRDPYDANVIPEFGYTLADAPQYDSKFPDHPLSRLRRALATIESTLNFEGSRDALQPYIYGKA